MSEAYHEPVTELSAETRDIHRCLTSLIEELQAVNWYHQRVDVTPDEELKAILAHNRNEEIEHAAMTLEWLRRRMPEFDEQLRTYLFTSGPIPEIEEASEGNNESADAKADASAEPTQYGDLGIGKFRKNT